MSNISGTILPDSKTPWMTYTAAGQITVAAATGQATLVRLTLQDGIQRSFTGSLLFDFANGDAELGLDTGAEAANTWYYMYAVPTAASDAVLTIWVTGYQGGGGGTLTAQHTQVHAFTATNGSGGCQCQCPTPGAAKEIYYRRRTNSGNVQTAVIRVVGWTDDYWQ